MPSRNMVADEDMAYEYKEMARLKLIGVLDPYRIQGGLTSTSQLSTGNSSDHLWIRLLQRLI